MNLLEAIKNHMSGNKVRVVFDANIEDIQLGDLEILEEMGAEFKEEETLPEIKEVSPAEDSSKKATTKGKKFKPTEKQLKEYRDQGMSAKEIAEKCGYAEGTVYAWFSDMKREEEGLARAAKDILEA